MQSLKKQNWTLIILIFIAAIIACVIGQLLVEEETVIVNGDDGTSDSVTVARIVKIPFIGEKDEE